MRQIITKQPVKNNQQGMALVMALIMLLLITILGVSAVRMSAVDTQISGNSIYSVLVFQGAESTLSRSASSQDWSNLPAAATDPLNDPVPVPSHYTPPEVVTGGGILNSSGEISVEDVTLNGSLFNNVANSTKYEYQVFRISGTSSLGATAATDRHTEGRAAQIPKQ